MNKRRLCCIVNPWSVLENIRADCSSCGRVCDVAQDGVNGTWNKCTHCTNYIEFTVIQ